MAGSVEGMGGWEKVDHLGYLAQLRLETQRNEIDISLKTIRPQGRVGQIHIS